MHDYAPFEIREGRTIRNAETDLVSNRDWPIRNLTSLRRRSGFGAQEAGFFLHPSYFCLSRVPVVQRIERRFPKVKAAFLLEFADVISSEQMTAFKRVE